MVTSQNKLPEQGLSSVIETFLKKYFELHGDMLPSEGLYHRILREVEKPLLEITLKSVDCNQVQAAKLLGINRNTLRKKVQQLGVPVKET